MLTIAADSPNAKSAAWPPVYNGRRMSYTPREVCRMAGQQGGPPGVEIPISRCGPLDTPTRPHPTSAIG
jgi:hypothetical protein